MTRHDSDRFSRRAFLITLGMAGGAAALATTLPGLARSGLRVASSGAAAAVSAHARDWAWLVGSWDVWHRRLKKRLAGDTHWQIFSGRSALWLTMNGQGTIDDNVVDLPGGSYRGLSLRAFEPASGKWAIWWLDGRDPSRIEPPVRGGFDGDVATFFGHDTFDGRPITVRFRWSDIHGSRPWWEQAFSADNGATWEVNWRNYFTRVAARPRPLPALAGAPDDFDFLLGSWNVRHRRRRRNLDGSDDWESFDGTWVSWPVLGGFGNASDSVMRSPSGRTYGVRLHAFDPAAKEWLSWHLDAASPATIASPLRGHFHRGTGTFRGDGQVDGRPVRTRVVWSHIASRSVRCERFYSADGGATWELGRVSDFTRTARI